MQGSRRKRLRRGITLIEMMVSMALTAVIVGASFQIFQEGMQLYRVNQAAGAAQSEVTKVIGVLTTDLGNAASGLTQAYTSGTPTDPDVMGGQPSGITFATPVGEGGAVFFDAVDSRIYWRRYVSYYFEPDPDPKGFDGKLWRAYRDVDQEAGAPHQGNRRGDIVLDWLKTNGTSYFAGASDVDRRLLGRGLSGFEIVPYRGEEFADITSATKIKLAYNIAVEAGDKKKSLRDSYYIRVTSRVVPRAAGGS